MAYTIEIDPNYISALDHVLFTVEQRHVDLKFNHPFLKTIADHLTHSIKNYFNTEQLYPSNGSMEFLCDEANLFPIQRYFIFAPSNR